MMLELSPLLTAAKAPADSMPASSRVCRSKPRPGDLAAAELRAEPAERLGVLVDDRDAVADLFQPAGDGGADAAAAHHDHVHDCTPSGLRRAGAVRGAYRREATPGAAARRGADRPASPCRGGARRRRGAGAAADVRTIAAVPSLSDLGQLPKRLVLGRPVRSDRAGESLLPKRLALPIFASDALSSVAYATQEILIILTLGGLALPLPRAVAGGRRRRPADHRGAVLPPGGARLPVGRRRLRGRDEEPRAVRRRSSSPARCSPTTC